MLQQFTWTQFLFTSLILTFSWYSALLLTAYRKEFFSFLGGKPLAKRPAGFHETSMAEPAEIENVVMGRSADPEGLQTVSIGNLNFAPSQSGGYSGEDLKSDQLGLIADVLQELKEIFQVLSKEDGSKKDFLDLVGMISEKYGRIGSHPNIGQVNSFIREHAPFAISAPELENLWD